MACEEVLWRNNGGHGLKIMGDERDHIEAVPTVLHGVTIQPDQMSDLDGFFRHPIRYAGMYGKTIAFFIADDLFTKYYDLFDRIDENTLFRMYFTNAGRDFRWNGKKWK